MDGLIMFEGRLGLAAMKQTQGSFVDASLGCKHFMLSIISLILSFRFSFSMSQVFLGALKPYLFIFAKLNQFFEKSNKLKINFIS